ATRRAKVVLPAPGVATARKSSLRRRRYSTSARRCQARSGGNAARLGGGAGTPTSLRVRAGQTEASAGRSHARGTGREGGDHSNAAGASRGARDTHRGGVPLLRDACPYAGNEIGRASCRERVLILVA